VGATVGQTVLDFGCREGNYAEIAAQIVGPGGGIYALDKNCEPLGTLTSRVTEKRIRNVVPVCTSPEVSLPLVDASVDLVLLYDVIHLIGRSDGQAGQTEKPSTAAARRVLLRELFRVLRARGTVSVYCPHLTTHTDVKSEQDIARELKGEGFVPTNDFHTHLVHDATLVSGHIMNFTKDPAHVERKESGAR
jgi:ubiquinone/menaquinone biosynthesis C-methylase UbiE